MKKLLVFTLILSLFSSLCFADNYSDIEQVAQQEVQDVIDNLSGNQYLLHMPNSKLTKEEIREKYEMMSELITESKEKIGRYKLGRNTTGGIAAVLAVPTLYLLIVGVPAVLSNEITFGLGGAAVVLGLAGAVPTTLLGVGSVAFHKKVKKLEAELEKQEMIVNTILKEME